MPEAAGIASRAEGDWRARLRSSKGGTALVLAITTALVLAGAWLIERQNSDPAEKGPEVSAGAAPLVGQPAPAFKGTTTEGKPYDSAVTAGKPTWLIFGASWCSDCRTEAPDTQAAWDTYSDRVSMVGVWVDDDQKAASDYVARLGLTFPQIADPQGAVGSQYRVMGVPAHFFVDSQGIVRSTHVGVISTSQIEAELAALK